MQYVNLDWNPEEKKKKKATEQLRNFNTHCVSDDIMALLFIFLGTIMVLCS